MLVPVVDPEREAEVDIEPDSVVLMVVEPDNDSVELTVFEIVEVSEYDAVLVCVDDGDVTIQFMKLPF